MTTKFTLMTLLLAAGVTCSAQKYTFGKQYGFNSTAKVHAITTDPSGNIYFTGSFSGIADFDPGPGTTTLSSNGTGDVFVVKSDPSGNLIWARSMGGTRSDGGAGIQADASGVYVAGGFQGTVDLDPGAGTFNVQSPVNGIYDNDIFMVKLDPSGEFVWGMQISGEKDDYTGNLVLKNNALYLTGMVGGITDFDGSAAGTMTINADDNSQAFLAKFDITGKVIWAANVDAWSSGYDLAVDNSGNVYGVGWFLSTADFDHTAGVDAHTAVGADDMYIWKVDNDGKFVYAKTFGGSHLDQAHAVTLDATGNIYITGYFSGVSDLEPGPGVHNFTSVPTGDPRAQEADLFVLKLDNNGNYIWANAYGGMSSDIGEEIVIDQMGHVYVGGTFYYSMEIDTYYGVTLTSSSQDVFILKLGADGSFKWVGQIAGEKLDILSAMAITAANEILVGGSFMGTSDLDPSGDQDFHTSMGVTDAFLVKLNGNVALTVSGVTEKFAARTLVYPNPATSQLNISFSKGGNNSVTIYNLAGAAVMSCNADRSACIDLSSLARGMYFVAVKEGESVRTEKVVVR